MCGGSLDFAPLIDHSGLAYNSGRLNHSKLVDSVCEVVDVVAFDEAGE
jgi:hypothetical protein